MVYKIEPLNKKGIICVRYSGVVTMEERTAVVSELCTYKQQNKPLRLLIDVSPVKHKMTALEQKIFAKYLVSLKEFEYAHVALLSKNASVPEELLDISVLQANLRLKEFASEETALDWLNSE
ncbi:MAG: STAS/SEC14 domain-containing protein [Bermanella sp.]